MTTIGNLTWILPLAGGLALGCGGIVVVDREGGDGGSGGEGGTTGTNTTTISFEPPGTPWDCPAIDCTTTGTSCSCKTACMGPDLRADCTQKEDGTIVCECHYDSGYMGLCGQFGGPLCGLPSGCCLDYLAE